MTIVKNKPTIPQLVPIIQQYYKLPGNGAGGSLHIVLDDGNIQTSCIQFCKQWALDRDPPDYIGAAIANIMLRMSITQVKKLSNRMDFY